MASKILIVEDSPTMRQLLKFNLKRVKGAEITEAGDGVDALKKTSDGKFDLILTDINMPLMDGLKFISVLRGDDANANKAVPIIVITTEGGEAERDKGLELGANSYITKPINPVQLMDAIREFLGS
ncbi:MAG: response regulator [Thermodesulfobacteriota bacterium]